MISTKVIIPSGLTLVSGTDEVSVEINLDKVVAKDTAQIVKDKAAAEAVVAANKKVQKSISQDIKYVNLNDLYEAKIGEG